MSHTGNMHELNTLQATLDQVTELMAGLEAVQQEVTRLSEVAQGTLQFLAADISLLTHLDQRRLAIEQGPYPSSAQFIPEEAAPSKEELASANQGLSAQDSEVQVIEVNSVPDERDPVMTIIDNHLDLGALEPAQSCRAGGATGGDLSNTYEILPEVLGTGAFGVVQVARHRKTQAKLAVKITLTAAYDEIDREIAMLRALHHTNIISIVDVFQTGAFNYIYMPMLSGGNLTQYVAQHGLLSESEALFVAYQTLLALDYLHMRGIVHRDLKPENLLLTSHDSYPHVVLADFGLARAFNEGCMMKTMCGTILYMAPEVLEASYGQGVGYTCAADCWSLGVTLYVVVTGRHPFTSSWDLEDGQVMRRQLKRETVEFPDHVWNPEFSLDAQVFVEKLLRSNPKERMTVEEALESDWVDLDFEWLRNKYATTVHPQLVKTTPRPESVRLSCMSPYRLHPPQQDLSSIDAITEQGSGKHS
ncbi:Calcium/calmodulin-dependent protein kinase type 1 [Mortierella sp. GBA30]|nr:Calcium/calmodulin-dependent protein kinase type 1 [Mortierella sp. GBA30]